MRCHLVLVAAAVLCVSLSAARRSWKESDSERRDDTHSLSNLRSILDRIRKPWRVDNEPAVSAINLNNRHGLRSSGKPTAFTAQQIDDFVTTLNDFRRGIDASNMEQVYWHDGLASLGQEWAEQCEPRHGSPLFNGDELGYDEVAQSNYAGPGPDLNIVSVFSNWTSQQDYYDYVTKTCSAPSGGTCDRYLLTVWSSILSVGCGYSKCDNMDGDLFLVCYFGPLPTLRDLLAESPYWIGPAPCTQCRRGQFYCNSGLCNNECTSAGPNCVCAADCQNCAKPTDDCGCTCNAGSAGPDCSWPCQDLLERCDKKQGWPAVMCKRPNFEFVREYCPKMCEVCTAGDPCASKKSSKWHLW